MLAQELTGVLRRAGADLVGFGDLQTVKGCAYPRGIAVAVALPVWVLQGMQQGPTMAYSQAKRALDARLEAIALEAETFLRAQGYQAQAQVGKAVLKDEQWRTPVPHKTVATRAGLGWIGKSCLLVTEEFGSALRLTSILTDAPLPCARPVDDSRCEQCSVCQQICPAGALTGRLWHVGVEREQMLRREACKQMQLRRMQELGLDQDLCGLCFAACPYTKRYCARASETEKAP